MQRNDGPHTCHRRKRKTEGHIYLEMNGDTLDAGEERCSPAGDPLPKKHRKSEGGRDLSTKKNGSQQANGE